MIVKNTDKITADRRVSEPIFIGSEIRRVLKQRERSVTWLANKICCDRRNIYDLFRRHSVDTHMLYNLSKLLDFDFFALYSNALESISGNEENTQS